MNPSTGTTTGTLLLNRAIALVDASGESGWGCWSRRRWAGVPLTVTVVLRSAWVALYFSIINTCLGLYVESLNSYDNHVLIPLILMRIMCGKP